MSDGSPDWMNSQRRRLNEASKHWAKRDYLAWDDAEDELIMTDWIDVDPKFRDEITVSQVLERTIEACRVRAEVLRKRYDIRVFVVEERRTTTTYVGLHDDPDDQWWSPDYYTRGE